MIKPFLILLFAVIIVAALAVGRHIRNRCQYRECADLSDIIERAAVHKLPGMTIADIMRGQCPDYSPEAAARCYLSLYADGVKIPPELWERYQVSGCSRIKIVIEAGGLETSLVIGIISYTPIRPAYPVPPQLSHPTGS